MSTDTMQVLLWANMRAGELRKEARGDTQPIIPTILKGEATASCALLLQALEEGGWEIVKKQGVCAVCHGQAQHSTDEHLASLAGLTDGC
jgi:cytochrome c553